MDNVIQRFLGGATNAKWWKLAAMACIAGFFGSVVDPEEQGPQRVLAIGIAIVGFMVGFVALMLLIRLG